MSREPEPQLYEILGSMEPGAAGVSSDLLPLVYDHLRRLARARMAHVPAGNTLQPTALVHEAYLRLDQQSDAEWNGKWHFFSAAAEAMRRILVEQARQKASLKRGGDKQRVEFEDVGIEPPTEDMLDLDRALTALEAIDKEKSSVVLLRYFAGLNREEIAETLGLSPRTVDRHWTFAKAWLRRELSGGEVR